MVTLYDKQITTFRGKSLIKLFLTWPAWARQVLRAIPIWGLEILVWCLVFCRWA